MVTARSISEPYAYRELYVYAYCELYVYAYILHTASSMCLHMKSVIELGARVCNCIEVGVGLVMCIEVGVGVSATNECASTRIRSFTIHALFASHALGVVFGAGLVYRVCCLVRVLGLSQRGFSRGSHFVYLCLA